MVTNDEFYENPLHGMQGPHEHAMPAVGDEVVIENEKTCLQKRMVVTSVNKSRHTYDLISKAIGGKNG